MTIIIKSERGTHTGTVTVHRGGKIFKRQQRVGVKKKEPRVKLRDDINKWIKNNINPIEHKMGNLEEELENIEKNMEHDIALDYYNSLISHSSIEVRGCILHHLDDSGRKKLMNDSDDDIREAVAYYSNDPETIKHLAKDQNNSVRSEAYKKYYTILLSPLSKDFLNGENIEFDNVIKEAIKTVSFENKENVKYLHDGLNSLYSNDSKYLKFNNYSKEEWLQSSNNLGSGLLKYFITKIYNGTEIQHHDGVDLKDMDSYIKSSLHELSDNEVDIDINNIMNYIKLQKKLTKQLLDIRFPDRDEFIVYRGTTKREIDKLDVKSGDKVNIKQNSISSWTLRKDTAEEFANKENSAVIKMVVSKNDIWSSFLTHSYSTFEQEMIIIGQKDRKAEVISLGKATSSPSSWEEEEYEERFN